MHTGHESNPLRDSRDRRLTRIAGPSALVFFGVTGDLARKKLLPAVYDLMNRGLLPPSFGLVGYGRREWDNDDFRNYVRKSVEEMRVPHSVRMSGTNFRRVCGLFAVILMMTQRSSV